MAYAERANRPHRIQVYVTEAELDAINEAVAGSGTSVSEVAHLLIERGLAAITSDAEALAS